jgi:prophage regulatory protein
MLLRLPQVIEQTGLSRSLLYSEVKAGRFPQPTKIGRRAVAWRRADLEQWASGRRDWRAAGQ